METIEVVEQYREQLIYNTAVAGTFQQLIHLSILIALREEGRPDSMSKGH